jgi:hypothetical protein
LTEATFCEKKWRLIIFKWNKLANTHFLKVFYFKD